MQDEAGRTAPALRTACRITATRDIGPLIGYNNLYSRCHSSSVFARSRSLPKSTEFGPLIRELRQRLGATQEQLAAKLGVTFASVNRWENGHSNPSPLAQKQIQTLLKDMGRDGRDLLNKYFANG